LWPAKFGEAIWNISGSNCYLIEKNLDFVCVMERGNDLNTKSPLEIEGTLTTEGIFSFHMNIFIFALACL